MALFAISYDSVEVLRGFSGEYQVEYDLLSDEGSVVIRRLGLVNEHVKQQQAFYGRGVDERHVGIPYPGTFVLDEDGVVTHRIFEQSYRPRPSAGYLFRHASGVPDGAVQVVTADEHAVSVAAWPDTERFHPLEIHDLNVEIAVADGWHIYTEPVPDGYTSLEARLTATSDIATWPLELPEGRPFRVEGLAETFSVLDGSIRFSMPFLISGARFELDGRPRAEPGTSGTVQLELGISFQACSDRECLPPTTVVLRFELEEWAQARP